MKETVETMQRVDSTRQATRACHTPAAIARSRKQAKLKLKADLKKSLGFSKKLRNLTDESLVALRRDAESVQLSRYLGEIAASILDDSRRGGDVPRCVEVCGLLHQRYSNFLPRVMLRVFEGLEQATAAAQLGAVTADDDDTQEHYVPLRNAIKEIVADVRSLDESDPFDDLTAGGGGIDVGADDEDLFGSEAGGRSAGRGTKSAKGQAAAAKVREDEKTAASRSKVLLRFAWELFVSGLYDNQRLMAQLITSLMGPAALTPPPDAPELYPAADAHADADGNADVDADADAADGTKARTEAASDVQDAAQGEVVHSAEVDPSTRTLDYIPRRVSDKAAKRIQRDMPLVVSFIKAANSKYHSATRNA